MKRVFLMVVPLVVLAILLVLFIIGDSEQPAPSLIPVKVHKVTNGSITETITIPGTTRSAEQALLRFQVSGRVSSKLVRLGDAVPAGTLLAVVDNPEIAPLAARAGKNLEQLKVQLAQAQRDFTRINGLYKEQAVTKQEWEKVKTGFDSAETAVSVATADLQRADRLADELNLRAPFAGVVTEIMIDEGDVVQAGVPAMRLSNPAQVELELAVSDAVIANLKQDQTVIVRRSLDPSAKRIQGKISDISPFREQGSLPQIVISLNAAEIQPGIAVSTELNISRETGVTVPINAVLMTGDNASAVYVVDGNQARLVAIRPLSIGGSQVMVDAGLEIGNLVITAGISQLFDGALIEVVE